MAHAETQPDYAAANDWTLLARFARDGSQPAFAELVRRHVDMVYAAAVRDVRDPATADDVVQATFLLLARKATALRPRRGRALAGWLFAATRLVARDAVRARNRRLRHEREAAMTRDECISPDPAAAIDWERIAPALNGAVAALATKDRDAVVLRFFENRSHREIGAALGVSEDAAKVRVARAIQKLRAKLSGQGGVQLSAAALTSSLTSHAVMHAPAATCGAASALGTAHVSAAIAALADSARRALAWMKIKSAATAVAVIVAAGGVGVWAVTRGGARPSGPVGPTAGAPSALVASKSATPTPAAVESGPRVCHWMAIVDAATADQLRAIATAMPSDGKQYVGYTVDAAALADRLRPALDSEHVRYLSPQIKWERAGGFGYGGDFIPLQTGDALYSIVTNGNGTALLERTRTGDARLTLDYSSLILFGGDLVNLNDKFYYQSVLKPGEAVMAIAPAMKLGVEQLYHVIVWQVATPGTLDPGARAQTAAATTEWLGAAKAGDAAATFEPVTAAFQPLSSTPGAVASGATATLMEIRQDDSMGGHSGGLVSYKALIRLTGLPLRAGSYVPSFRVWTPASSIGAANVEWRRENGRRVAFGVTGTELPYYRRTASLRFGVALTPPRDIGTLSTGDAGRSLRVNPSEDAKYAATVQLVKIEPTEVSRDRATTQPTMQGTNVVAKSINVGLRYNVEMSAIDVDGKPVEFRGMQWGGGRQTPELTWSTSFAAPPERIRELHFAVQPIEWAEFEDVPLLAAVKKEDAVLKTTVVVAAASSQPVAAAAAPTSIAETIEPGSPQAFEIAFREAIRAGDREALKAMVYATTPLQRQVAELTTEQMAVMAELARAAIATYGRSDAEAARLAFGEQASRPLSRFDIKGDIATPIHEDGGAQVVGPWQQLRRVDGKWRLDFTTMGIDDDPAKAAQVKAYVDAMPPVLRAMTETAREIRDGKYETARDAAAAMERKQRGQ